MGIQALWLIQAVLRGALVLASATLVGLCLAAPDSFAGVTLQATLTWTGRQITDLLAAVSQIGAHVLTDGASVLCLTGTEECVWQPLVWQSESLMESLPPALQSGRLWLVAALGLGMLIAFRRGHVRRSARQSPPLSPGRRRFQLRG